MTTLTPILLAALLALPRPKPPPAEAGTTQQQDLSDDQIQARVQAYLGDIESRITADHWKALGPRAGSLLQSIALDPAQFPSRRAKAAYGLALAAPDQAEPVLTTLAQDDSVASGVRIAAIQGMARIVAPAVAARKLSKVLRSARDPGVRGVAAEVMAASGTSGCAQVKAQVDREPPVQRNAFSRALARCGE
jgi:hypothetical protein